MESTDSSVGHHQQQQPPQDQVAAPPPPPPPQPHLPPGFRFHPTDEELVVHYLKRKTQSAPLPVSIIAEVDLYKFDPWELPAKAVFGEQEWYFFSPRDRKYPNGARPNRAATSGYWKATGTDKPVLSSGGNQKVGVKKALVFYGGKPPRGVKTNWIMHEYRLADSRPSNKSPGYDNNNKKGSLRLDDWVLCRIYKKSNAHRAIDQERDDAIDDMMMMSSMNIASMSSMGLPLSLPTSSLQSHQLSNKPMSTTLNYTSFLDQQGMYDGMMDPNSLSNLAASASASTSGFPLKRALPNLFYQDPLSSGKKSHHHDHDETPDRIDVESTSMGMGPIASLLNQFPTQNQTHTQNQNSSLQHQQQMLGGLQQYPLSGLNWYS